MDTRTTLSYLAAAVAMLAMVALAPFFFAAGLVAPLWAVVGFILVWVSLFVLGCLWFRRKPLRTLLLPVAAAAVWIGGMSAGEAWLGWTA
ncbi:MAG TPA: hypothetical protein VEQ66_10740 [Propionibacteriaceae bacterium]|nr:hypothetical protein [Propionibacteriaceae bacterium]